MKILRDWSRIEQVLLCMFFTVIPIAICAFTLFLCGCKPSYRHFSPSDESPMKIEFDYPSTWQSGFNEKQIGNSSFLFFEDPTQPISPGLEPNFTQGQVMISLELVDPASFSLHEEVSVWMHEIDLNMAYTKIKEQPLKIDGYAAYGVTYRIDPLGSMLITVPMIDERVFVLVKDQYYLFTLSMPEADRNSGFGQGFDYLIRSITFVD